MIGVILPTYNAQAPKDAYFNAYSLVCAGGPPGPAFRLEQKHLADASGQSGITGSRVRKTYMRLSGNGHAVAFGDRKWMIPQGHFLPNGHAWPFPISASRSGWRFPELSIWPASARVKRVANAASAHNGP